MFLADVVFVLGIGSSSKSAATFAHEKNVVKKLASALSFSSSHHGVVTYGSSASAAIGLGKFQSIAAFGAAIDGLQVSALASGAAKIDAALALGSKMLADSKAMKQTLVLLTPEKLSATASAAASGIADAGSNLLIIGTGSEVSEDDLTGSADDVRMMADAATLADPDAFNEIVHMLRQGIKLKSTSIDGKKN